MNKHSPFISFCVTAVVCIVMLAVAFVFTYFSTDTVSQVSTQQQQSATRLDLPIQMSQTTREMKTEPENNSTNLGNVGSSSSGGSNTQPDPSLPGVTTSFTSNGQWYQDLTAEQKQGGGTVIATVDVGGVAIGLYSNLPWPADDNAFIFNAPTAQKDVIGWLEQGGSTGIDPNRRGVFVYEHNSSTWTGDIDGVTCLGFAPVPSIVNRNYCDAFTKDMWSKQSTPAASEYGYHPNSGRNSNGARKYCAILSKDGTTYYLPLTACDAKGHTFPGGALQTHMQITGTSGGAYLLNVGDKGHRGIAWTPSDIVANLGNPVSGAEPSPLRDYIKVNIEIYKAPSGSLKELNQYTIEGFIAY